MISPSYTNHFLFELGQIVVTLGALFELEREDFLVALDRHTTGDWGDVNEDVWKRNDVALEFGGRLFSQYLSENEQVFDVDTDSDRSFTTFSLANE